MSHACCGGPDEEAARGTAAAPSAADMLALAASPTFALMALLSGILESDPAAVMCAAAGAWPLTGMTAMYLLMSAFHATPWLKFLRERWPAALANK
ncbi:hypothetical protein [Mesorhizobium sp. CN2-181]|uniref:hypothetical protein n=1 Tax=Mesorhizobium yinganensis TaxID=3157707 RepID=UPI0032B8493C